MKTGTFIARIILLGMAIVTYSSTLQALQPGGSLWTITHGENDQPATGGTFSKGISSSIDAIEQTLTTLVQTTGDLMVTINLLDNVVVDGFLELSTAQNALSSQINELEAAINLQLQNLETSTAEILSEGETLNITVVTCCNHLGTSQEKLFSEIENLETTITQQFQNLETSNEKIFSKVDALETTVANDFTDLSTSQAKLFSEIENLESAITQQLQNLETSNATIVSTVDALETTVVACCDDIDTSQATLFSKVDTIEAELIYGVNALYGKLVSMEPLVEPFLISQDTIGNGSAFVVRSPGYYMLTESVSFNSGSAISILADNVIIDLNGMSIIGTDGVDNICINVLGTSGVTIKNGALFGAQGIEVQDTTDVIIDGITGVQNQSGALVIMNVQEATIQNCIISNVNGGNGLTLDSACSNIIIKNCSVTEATGYGYYLQGSNIALHNSIAQANGTTGICCGNNLSKAQLLSNSVSGNGTDGILLNDTALDVHVISNRIIGNTGVGLNDTGATNTISLNNLSAGNGTDYAGVKSVAVSKATSYWLNVHG
jgi:hypothetical protein